MKKSLAIIIGILFINIAVVTCWQFKYHINGILPPISEWTILNWEFYIAFTIGQLLITFIIPLVVALVYHCLKWLIRHENGDFVIPSLVIGIFSIILLCIIHIGIKYNQEQNTTADLIEGNEDLLFRNKEYKFRFKYPRGWRIKRGDGQNIKAKVVGENGTNCNVAVYKKPMLENLSNNIVMSAISVNDLVKGMSNKFPDIKFSDRGKTKVDNRDAIYGVYSTSYSTGNITIEAQGLVVQTFEAGAMYYITCVAEPKVFSENIDKFKNVVQTFVFENW